MSKHNRKRIAILTSGWSIDYIMSVLKGVKSVTDKEDADVFVFVCYKFTDQLMKINITGYKIFSLINYKDFDGVIILGNIFDDEEVLQKEVSKIKKAGIPAISILRKIQGIDYVGLVGGFGFNQLLNHTREVHNYHDYAFIGGPDNDESSVNKYENFQKFIENNNLTLKENRLILNGDYTASFGEKAARELLKDPSNIPEIIICINDYTALSVMAVAKTKGIRVPEDLKVVGYDDIEYAKQATPSITTCNNRSFDFGQYAALKVLKKKVQKLPDKKFYAELVIRQSCGCKACNNEAQMNYFINSFSTNDESERFNSQLRHMEDVFLMKTDSQELINELSNFFYERHYFEGSSFALQLQKEYVDAFVNKYFSHKMSNKIGDEMTSVVRLLNDKKLDTCTFKSRDIIPPNFDDGKPSLNIIFPLVTLNSFLGYIVCKNNTKLLEAKRAYQWIRNLCNNFENFKQKCSYKILSEKYMELSTQDALCGTLNRLGYNTYCNELFEKNKSSKKNNVIIFIDINNMKIINDKFGHLQGDFAIKTVANSILNTIPKNALAVRYGGDEFVILTDEETMSGDMLCEAFSDNLKRNCENLKLPFTLTASIGTKIFKPGQEITLDQAVAEVDQLMYHNKKKYHKE